ncbi:hypothetical protein [Sphingomonas sp. Root241]|uniref:PAS domain-containing protein n=1 Tax=Sphingomonas sp. Root241 TaxID=1736501 RepID=UPI0007004EC2|nr:hypothetical protein [Sphingomonas sp. Root241]KRC81315.1 hypothetical protein ASE13_02645 [Sphingomonas sp. Root241]
MDMARGINEPFDSTPEVSNDDAVSDRPMEIGADERRMHVRAYNYWVSLLHGRAYPSIENLDPENIADFGPHSVLLDFTRGVSDPSIRFLGESLREECGFTPSIQTVGEVPSRSLLSRLTDHYLQIIANRAPIGFEAEFVGQRGHNTLYRGILMPFSSDGETIDFIYGVINWKELVDAETQARLNAEIEESRRIVPQNPVAAAVWADGPSAGFDAMETVEALVHGSSLADQLMLARESAAAARASDTRSRSALYRALSRAYDFALAAEAEPEGYQLLLRDAGLNVQARAPMTPPVKLVFGVDYDKTRLTEFAAVLNYARRQDVPQGGFDAFLEVAPGGIKGVVKAERDHRRPAPKRDVFAQAAEEMRSRPPLGHVAIPAQGEFVVLLARAGHEGLDIVASFEDDTALTERAIRKAAA